MVADLQYLRRHKIALAIDDPAGHALKNRRFLELVMRWVRWFELPRGRVDIIIMRL